jgi:hypothetical protein
MKLKDFVVKVAGLFKETDANVFTAETKFKELKIRGFKPWKDV